MSAMIWVLGTLAVVVILWLVSSYNAFVNLRTLVDEGWSDVDVQLKRKYDLIPTLLSTVKAYAKHEKELFSSIAALRTKAISANDVKEKGEADRDLSQKVSGLFAIAENYPQLRASENFLNLQNQLKESEDLIALSRRYYNGTVRNFNMMVSRFPSMILAMMFGFGKREFFQIERQLN